MPSRPSDQAGESPTVAAGGPEQVRKAALVAAERLFSQNGIHAVSVREIAREIGVSHTLLHLYFGNKNEIVRQVLNSRNGDHAASIQNAEDLAEGVEDAFRAIVRERDWLRVVAASLVEGADLPAAPTLRSVQAAYLERVSDAGASAPVDARLVSVALASMALGWAVAADSLLADAGLDAATADDLADGLATIAGRMVRSHS